MKITSIKPSPVFKNYHSLKKDAINFTNSNKSNFDVKYVDIDFFQKFERIFFDSLMDQKDELYTFLDSSLIDEVSISEAVSNLFEEDAEYRHLGLFHKTMGENVETIKKNGFNPLKIATTKFGPGFYFGACEESVLIYPGMTLKVGYDGNTAHGKDLHKYGKLNSKITNLLREKLNLQYSPKRETVFREEAALSRFVHEYVRQKIVEELGIDGAFAGNREGYFVVFNPDAVKNIDIYKQI